MKAEIVSIGDELLIGETINNNAAFMGRLLTEANIEVAYHTVTGDEINRMVEAISTAWNRADIVLTTGGLGPTHDDITKDAICRFFKTELENHQDIVDEVRERFRARGKIMPEIVTNQGLIPAGAELIRNEIGSAFGIMFRRDGKVFIAMPGVPFEMRAMMEQSVIPILRQTTGNHSIFIERIKTYGLFESELVTRCTNLDKIRKLVTVAILPKPSGVELRFTAAGDCTEDTRARMSEAVQLVKADIGENIVSMGNESLEHVVADLLTRHGLTLATAESCTGGLVSSRLTDVAGSSTFFKGGVVSYSNEVKYRHLGVAEKLIHEFGAVSENVAGAMASGVRDRLETDYGVATTGIAGPTGGTAEKPVGLVYVAVAGAKGVTVESYVYRNDRSANKVRFASAALNLLRKTLYDDME